jgi:hypothetical protein
MRRDCLKQAVLISDEYREQAGQALFLTRRQEKSSKEE